jgi:hypothetical protein
MRARDGDRVLLLLNGGVPSPSSDDVLGVLLSSSVRVAVLKMNIYITLSESFPVGAIVETLVILLSAQAPIFCRAHC